jgi:transposase
MKVKYTIREFNEQFQTDADCLQYLFDQRFPNGGTCDKCGKSDCFHPVTNRKCYACAWCGFQLHPTAGTIFHKSSTSLKTWFHAMFIMTASRNGVSAMELMRQVGVTYKTAWRMNHQIRQLMNDKPATFCGTVEADETYIGGKHKGRSGRGAHGKTPVIGVLERGGSIVAKATPDVSSDSVVTNIAKTTRLGATVMTDEFPSYRPLGRVGFDHKTIKHREHKYVDGDIHTNGIESFWAQLKRSINGTFHHVSPKHLQKYLNEFSYRHNHRKSETPMFSRLIETAGEQRDLAV